MSLRKSLPRPARKLLWRHLVRQKQACLIARTTIQGRSPERRHTHDFCELFVVESGRGRHEINGRSEELLPGQLIFLCARDVHAIQGFGRESVTFVNVAVEPKLAEGIARRLGGVSGQAFGARRGRRVLAVVLSSSARVVFDAALHRLADGERDRLAAEGFLLAALQAARESLTLGGGRLIAPQWLAQAVEAVKKTEVFQGGVAGLVAAAGRSGEHVAREARRHYGLTPGQLVTQARLEHAARRLELSEVNVTELALECGFESLSHFVRLFHRRYGEPPLRYRRRRWGLA